MLIRLAALILSLFAQPLWALSQSQPVSDERFHEEFHWAVAVINEFHGGVCGGSLIAPRWVLTAAHCAGSPRHVLVDSAVRSVARKVEVAEQILHPNYDADSGQYDIALLHLAEDVSIEPATVATLLDTLMLVRRDLKVRLLGWGRSQQGQGVENRLRVARARLGNLMRRGSVFAYQGHVGPCGSDSGSPMLIQTLDKRWLIVGVARAADGMCSAGKGSAVYTDVGKVEDFISRHLATENGSSENTAGNTP